MAKSFRDKNRNLTQEGLSRLNQTTKVIRPELSRLLEEGYSIDEIVTEVVGEVIGWTALANIIEKRKPKIEE